MLRFGWQLWRLSCSLIVVLIEFSFRGFVASAAFFYILSSYVIIFYFCFEKITLVLIVGTFLSIFFTKKVDIICVIANGGLCNLFTYSTFCFLDISIRMLFVVKACSFLYFQDDLSVPTRSICQMQSLLLLIISYVASILVCNKASTEVLSDQAESRCFVDAVVVFCKLQHLSPTTPIKTQVSLSPSPNNCTFK